MKLLILTQIVDINDDILGFMHGWIAEFAKKCDQVIVIALGAGRYDLPGNVKVLSLGKEKGGSKIKYLINFYKYIWQERKNYDAVFAHMNKEYVILGGWYWRLIGKKVALWYVHKQVSCQLKLAEKIANVIFTASPESFNLKSQKLKIIGHGIDLNKFNYSPRVESHGNFKIIYVGRISRIKNQKLLIEAMDILNKKGINDIKIDLVGKPIYQDDYDYKNELVKLIDGARLENQVQFIGSVPNKDMAEVYQQADLSVNLCPVGGMDKAVLESMADGLPVIAYNKTFAPLLKQFENSMLDNLSKEELAEKITSFINLDIKDKNLIGRNLSDIVSKNYGLAGLVDKIVGELS
ncbi:MAG: glycosyltransferase family 4 protein [Patescibacteria group bacterium]|nr:glycosyltransferase family 4 protein [Patescibacteria group bacterium]